MYKAENLLQDKERVQNAIINLCPPLIGTHLGMGTERWEGLGMGTEWWEGLGMGTERWEGLGMRLSTDIKYPCSQAFPSSSFWWLPENNGEGPGRFDHM